MSKHSPFPWRVIPVLRDGFVSTPDFRLIHRPGVFHQVDVVSRDGQRICRLGPDQGDWKDRDLVERVLQDGAIIQQSQAMAETMSRLGSAMERVLGYLRSVCTKCAGSQCQRCPMNDARALASWAMDKAAEHVSQLPQ
jgi:hypothetical protein